MAGGNPPSGPSRPRRPQQQQQQRKPLQAMGSKELLKRQSATDLGAAKAVGKKRSKNALVATAADGPATGGNATVLGQGARSTKPAQPPRPTLHRAPSSLNPSALSFQPSPIIPAAAEVPSPEPAPSPPVVASETLPRRREQTAPTTAFERRIVSGPAVIPGVGNHASSSASSSNRSRHVSRLSHPTNTFPHRPAGLPEKPTLAMKVAEVPEAPLVVGRMSTARPQPSPGPVAASVPTLPVATWPECPVVPAPLSLPISLATAPPAAKADEDDLTPRTRRRVAGQGLKKAMSEAALRRKRVAAPPGGRLPSLPGTSASRSRVASDPHSTPAPRSKRSQQLASAKVDDGEKENAPPGPVSPATPSPLPLHTALEPVPPVAAFNGEEEYPGSPPSPAALLLSASFTSWPLAAPAPIRKARFAEAVPTAQPMPEPSPVEPEAEPLVEPTLESLVDEVEVEEDKASKRNSYVPRPLLLPSKLARNASSSSTIVIRSPKSSSGSTTTTSGSTGVRSQSLPRGSSAGGLTFSAFAESGATTRPARPASLVFNTGSGAVSIGPGGRQFAPSVHSRASSAGSVSPPMSPTLVATTPRLRTLREEGSPTKEGGAEGHSRTVSVGKGRRRERPMSTSSNVGLGLRLEQAFAAAAIGDEETLRKTLRSGNGQGIDDDGSGRGPEEASLLPSPFVATGTDQTSTAVIDEPSSTSPKKARKRAMAPAEHRGKLPAAVAARRANRNAVRGGSAPREEEYSSLQDLLEREGVQHTRVVTPVRKAVVDMAASPPKRPIIEAVAVKQRSSLMDIFTAVKDVLIPPPSSVARGPPGTAEPLPVSSPPRRDGHRSMSSSSTVSSFGAPLNAKSAELMAAEEAVRGRIAGWVQQTQESLLDELRPTVVLPGQKVPSTPAPAARSMHIARVGGLGSPIQAFTPDATEGDDRPFRVGSPPPVSAPPVLPTGVTIKPAARPKLATPTLVKTATARSLMRKPSRPVLTAGHIKAPALIAAVTTTPSPLSSVDNFVLIHNFDEPDAVATFEDVPAPSPRQAKSKSQIHNFFDTPPVASTSSAPHLSTTHKGVRRQASVEGLARAKLGKLLEEEEERWIKRKKSLGALAYGPPPRIIIWESP